MLIHDVLLFTRTISLEFRIGERLSPSGKLAGSLLNCSKFNPKIVAF